MFITQLESAERGFILGGQFEKGSFYPREFGCVYVSFDTVQVISNWKKACYSEMKSNSLRFSTILSVLDLRLVLTYDFTTKGHRDAKTA